MLLVAGMTLGVLLGYATGGQIGRLAHLHLESERLLVVVLVTSVLSSLAGILSPGLSHIALPLRLGNALAIIIVCVVSIRAPGASAIAAGAFLNAGVIIANRGMPVSAVAAVHSGGEAPALIEALGRADGLHIAVDHSTRIPLLADIVVVPWPTFLRASISLGDALLVIGAMTVLIAAMLGVGARPLSK